MKPILEIQGLSKKYRINHIGGGYLSLRDRMSRIFQPNEKSKEDFWALKDVSFTLNAGDSIGVVGKNGAGKSTLLKILSRITPPTKGRFITRGRMASLLEVGTGFHPELSGRENIFFNGSLLGMKRFEILSKFDEIIEFSGTGKFLDTPLKHYSSGMQLRLAFSVAAFLEPEILVIDEVLAVGDAEFQKKCLGKMEDVSKSGRTILFVSHNMAAVSSLCKKGMFLKSGAIAAFGDCAEVINNYLSDVHNNQDGINRTNQEFARNNRETYISRIQFHSNGVATETIYMGSDLEVIVSFESKVRLEAPIVGVIIYDSFGAPLLCINNKNYGITFTKKGVHAGDISMKIPSLNLTPGMYSIDIHFGNEFKDVDVKKNCFQFSIQYKHFLPDGEPLLEKYNRVYYADVKWNFIENHLLGRQ